MVPVTTVEAEWYGATYRVEMQANECTHCGFAEIGARDMPELMRRLAKVEKGNECNEKHF